MGRERDRSKSSVPKETQEEPLPANIAPTVARVSAVDSQTDSQGDTRRRTLHPSVDRKPNKLHGQDAGGRHRTRLLLIRNQQVRGSSPRAGSIYLQ